MGEGGKRRGPRKRVVLWPLQAAKREQVENLRFASGRLAKQSRCLARGRIDGEQWTKKEEATEAEAD